MKKWVDRLMKEYAEIKAYEAQKKEIMEHLAEERKRRAEEARKAEEVRKAEAEAERKRKAKEARKAKAERKRKADEWAESKFPDEWQDMSSRDKLDLFREHELLEARNAEWEARKAKAEAERKRKAEERKRKAEEAKKAEEARKAKERKRKAELKRFKQTFEEKYFEFRLNIPDMTNKKWKSWKKKGDGVESKGSRKDMVEGLEKSGVRLPLIENWVDGRFHMEELRKLSRIEFHEDDKRLADIVEICNNYEDIRAIDLCKDYALEEFLGSSPISSPLELTAELLTAELFTTTAGDSLIVGDITAITEGTGLSGGGTSGLQEKIEIICDGVRNKKMTERWHIICNELNEIDKLLVGEKSILSILLNERRFSSGEFEILYQKIISQEQQTDETLQLLKMILGKKISGEDIEKYERWGVLEEKYHDSLLRILDGENADFVLDQAGLLN